jgi:hypothetical protein
MPNTVINLDGVRTRASFIPAAGFRNTLVLPLYAEQDRGAEFPYVGDLS